MHEVRNNVFRIGSDAPQNSLLGGKLFNSIMDVVLCELDKLGLGCHMNEIFAGKITNTDDLILFSPSIVCVQEILDLCVKVLLVV